MRNAGVGGDGLNNSPSGVGFSRIIQWSLGSFNECGTVRILTYSRRILRTLKKVFFNINSTAQPVAESNDDSQGLKRVLTRWSLVSLGIVAVGHRSRHLLLLRHHAQQAAPEALRSFLPPQEWDFPVPSRSWLKTWHCLQGLHGSIIRHALHS